MAKLSKNRKAALEKYNLEELYSLDKAAAIVKDITTTKFDASFDVDVRLGVDPRKANQMVRGIATLPHGTGKEVKVLVLCTPDKVQDALDAGADFAGLDEYVEKIKGGWTDIDVIITMPACMGKVGALGRVLGPRGLMPNPKAGTVTNDIANAIKEFKAGKLEFRADKAGIVHVRFGKASFTKEALFDNLKTLQESIDKNKPSGAKGKYWKTFYVTSTMGPSVQVDINAVQDYQPEG